MYHKFFALFTFTGFLVGCSSSSTTNGVKLHDLKGKVVSIDAGNKKIKIDHRDIPGVMPAMAMTFDFEDSRVIEGLAAGDSVEGKLKGVDGKYIVSELRKTASGAAAPPAKIDPEAEIKASLAKLSPADRKLAEEQYLCPITAERLGSMDVPVKITLKGESVFLCCTGCKEKAEKDPEATLEKVAALKKK